MSGLSPSRSPPDGDQLKRSTVDKLKRLRIAKVIEIIDAQEKGGCQEAEINLQRPDSVVYLNVGSSLLGEIKRNQSFQA